MKAILILYFLTCSIVHVFGQYSDVGITEIINSKNDTLFKSIDDYSFHALKYRESISAIRKINGQVDSIRNSIRSSSLTREEQRISVEIINLVSNDKSGDVSLKVKEFNQLLISSISKHIRLEFIYELDKNYQVHFLTIELGFGQQEYQSLFRTSPLITLMQIK